MPPRRSSRAPSAAEPVEAPPAKRKRGQSTQPEEPASKPPSRAGRSSRAAATKARSSLAEVAESGDEEEPDVAPARKKSRPSVESDVKEEEDDDEPPPPKARRAATSRKQRVSMDVDEEPAELPKRRASSRQPSVGASRRASAAGPSRTARKPRVVSVAESVPEQEEEVEEEVVAKPKRGRAAVKDEPVSEAEMKSDDDEEFEEPSARKPRKGKAKAPTKATKATSKKAIKRVVVVDSDDEEEVPAVAEPSTSTAPQTASAQEAPQEEPEEEEEEKSLFDPVPMPDPESLPKAMPEEPQGPKPRLVISKMALVNFKSYAGRQEIGPFHKSFSAIVGPNGSGKSNTIDALLFVFGYRASKMRQGKVSELIHNSARYPDLEECSVEIHFRDIMDLPGPDAYEVIPGTKLVVARTAYKNNQSKYTINGKPSSYKEVQKLLKGRGIDLDHNRFLILQGEVESIAQMKPKAPNEHEDGLLEYLEDIIGTSGLKEPIDEAMAEVERLTEERQTKMHRLRIVGKEKKALEEKRKEALDYYRMKNDHTRALSRYWQWIIWRLGERHTQGAEKLAQMQAESEEKRKENEELIQYAEDLENHHAQMEGAFQTVQEEAETAERDLKDKEKQGLAVKERQKHAKNRKKKLEKSVQEDSQALRTANHTITDRTETLEKGTAQLEVYQEELAEAEEELEKIQEGLSDVIEGLSMASGKTQKIHQEIQAKQKELQPWTTKIDAKKTQLDVAQSERDTLVQRSEALQKAVDEGVAALSTLQTEQKDKLREQGECKAKKEELKGQIAKATQRHQAATVKVDDLRKQAGNSRGVFEEARASQTANRSRSALLDALNGLKLAVSQGRLGDLGTIPDKYDVAISTAAGGSLANLVVEEVEQGKACIDYLRSGNIGRASFMVLDKIPEHKGMAPIKTPENTSGAMSGGGGSPQRGAMNSKLSTDIPPETLKQYERDTVKAEEQLYTAQKELAEIEAELERLKKAGPDLDMTYQKLTLEIETRKVRIAEATKRVEDLKAQNKPSAGDAARIKELDRQIASHESALKELHVHTEKINDAIKELESKIMAIGGAKLMTQKSKVTGLREHILNTTNSISKAESEINKAEKDIKRLSGTVETNKQQLAEVSEELEALNKEVNEVEEYLEVLRGAVETAQNQVENQKEVLDKIKKKLDKARNHISDAKKEQDDVNAEIERKLDEHDRLKLLDIDDDEDDSDDEEEDGEKDKDAEGEGAEAPEEPDVKPDPDASKPAKKSEELKSYTSTELSRFRKEELVADTELLDGPFVSPFNESKSDVATERIKNSKVDLTVLKEYKKQQALFDNRARELEEATEARDKKKQEYDDLRKHRLDKFMTGFNQISLKLKEMYQMITLGGNAELELVDSMDPFAEGIIFSVMPPKKSWKNISNLSGGEKTLSSLALVFALHVFKPTPLYFMDEIDAALDFRNVSIVANYIKDRTKNAQFIIISLRNDMFELSHRLIGIYKTANATRSISIDNHKLLTTIPQFAPQPNNAT
ncbi:RecF/RecN/SMC N terminal domain-containing protein [Coprinopsis sp. MPI-PUGE-AT-0042]|nr:RecF/RecN/SMC N terminal domain-containing protein [Coprinopsis sp. MPI-PUGE-AT-0042]